MDDKTGVEIESNEVDNLELARRFKECEPREWFIVTDDEWMSVHVEGTQITNFWFFNSPDTHPGNATFFMWMLAALRGVDVQVHRYIDGHSSVTIADGKGLPLTNWVLNKSAIADLVECYCELREQEK